MLPLINPDQLVDLFVWLFLLCLLKSKRWSSRDTMSSDISLCLQACVLIFTYDSLAHLLMISNLVSVYHL